jgi:TonB family protein
MKVIIKEPCLEDWDKMKVGIDSRHCDLCNKNVIDFTQKNRAEIITYLLDRSNERVCGRMKGNEFEMKEADIPVLMEVLRAPKYRSNAFLILAIVCSSVFSSCEVLSEDDAAKKNAVVGVEKFGSMRGNNSTLGMMSLNDSTIDDENSTPFVSDETSEKRKGKKIRFVPPPIPPESLPSPGFGYGDGEAVVGEPVIEPIYAGQIDNEIETVLTFAEVMPEFPGGMENLLVYLNKNIIYPTVYREQGIEGKVYVQFVVTFDGEITNPVVLRGVPNAELFSREAIRVVRSMPKWTPGKNDGKNVSVRTTIPIYFELSE